MIAKNLTDISAAISSIRCLIDVIAAQGEFDVSGCETNIDCRLLTALLLCDVAGAGDEVDDWLPVRMRHLLDALAAAP